MNTTTLTQTIQSAQSGDNAAFETLFREYSKPVYYLALKFMKNKHDAEEISQEVFLTAYQKLAEIKTPETFPTWLNRITANKCKNALTRRNRPIDKDIGELAETEQFEEENVSFLPEMSLNDSETARMIVHIIDCLPEAQRMCVYAYYYQNLKVAQIAEEFSLNETTVRNRLALARKKIKSELERLNHEEGIKLYGIPFILFPMLKADASAFDVPAEVLSRMLDGVMSQMTSVTVTVANAAGTSSTTVTGTTAASVGAGKIAVAAIAGLLVVGGIIGGVILMSNSNDDDGYVYEDDEEEGEEDEDEEDDDRVQRTVAVPPETERVESETAEVTEPVLFNGELKIDLSNEDITDEKLAAMVASGEIPNYVTHLELSQNQITDISPLSGLTNLRELKLHFNQITDITPLSGLNNLILLTLSENQITDISPLAESPNLSRLYLGDNQITDISQLSGMVNLTFLELDSNHIMDISPISGLVNLTHLWLDSENITDISPLIGLINLEELVLSDDIFEEQKDEIRSVLNCKLYYREQG